MNATKAKKVEQEWSRYAKEGVTVEQIGGALYAFGSELAAYRIHYRLPKGRVGYSENLGTWFFCLEIPAEIAA